MTDAKNLYDVARMICHEAGYPWTDPRTGKTYHAADEVLGRPAEEPSGCLACDVGFKQYPDEAGFLFHEVGGRVMRCQKDGGT